MTKVEELRTKSPECPRGKACHPAGLESALQHQSAAAVLLRQLRLRWGATGLRLDTGGVLGLQLSSPGLVVGNMCCHSQGGEDSLLGPLPHLSPFTLQPGKMIVTRTDQPKILHNIKCRLSTV